MSSISIKTSKIINTSTPSDFKNLTVDDNHNGIPDFADNLVKSKVSTTTTEIIVNGKKYSSWDQVPPHVQQEYKDLTITSESTPSRQFSINITRRDIVFIAIGFLLATLMFAISR